MKCYICGSELSQEDKFCPECGAKVYETQMTPESVSGNEPGNGAGPYGGGYGPYPPKDNSGPLKIVLAVGIIMLILAVAVLAFYLVNSTKDDGQEATTTQAKAEEEDTEEEETEEEEDDGENASSFGYAYNYDLSGLKRIGVAAEADYYISGGKYDYRGYRAMDGDTVSSWQTEHCPSTLTADLGGEHEVKAISFKLGNWREDHYFYENCRPSKIMISLGDLSSFELEFSNEKKEFVLEFSKPIKASKAEFKITDFYTGTQYSGGNDDICISEITLYEE